MTGRVKDGSTNERSLSVLSALELLLPRSETQASDPVFLDSAGLALSELALVAKNVEWRGALPKGGFPLWLEDALLLEVIPRAGVILGERWANDTLSFVDVSIASARLQELVRRHGLRATQAAATPLIPVIMPPWEQHALAATLAAHRINRAGQRSVLLSGLTADRLSRLPAVQTAPVLLISSTYRPKTGRLKQFVAELRQKAKTAAPIVSGGPAFPAPYIDFPASSGAVCHDNDPVAALLACGVDLARDFGLHRAEHVKAGQT